MNRWNDRRSARPPRRRGAGRAGFTLVEIILVLAVLGLLSALLLPGVNALLRTMNNEDPDQIVWDAVTSAREQALLGNRTVLLRFDAKKRRLDWGDVAGREHKELPEGVGLQFLQPKEGGGTILLGGVLMETQEVPVVRFYPDGTCDRFRIQLRRGTAAPQVIPVDPWTCAPMFDAPK